MTKAEISTALIALYGAVVSTIAVSKQFINDRVKVKLKVSWNMSSPNDPEYDGETLVVLTAFNSGRRPVTIVHTGAWRLHPHLPFMLTGNRPVLPHEIKEGEAIVSIMNQANTDRATIDYWQAIDATGRTYKHREASWLRHWKSVYQWKLASRKRRNTEL